MKRSFGFVDYHLVASSDQYCYGFAVWAVLDEQHAIGFGPKLNLTYLASRSELRFGQFREARDNSGSSGNGHQLDFYPVDPPDCRQVVGQKEVVSLVVEAPLAQDQGGSRIFAQLHLLDEVRLLLLVQGIVRLSGFDVDVVFGFGFRRLERASENGNFGVFDGFGHLRVRHRFVKDDTFDHHGVFQACSNLVFHLDQVKVNVLPFKVSHRNDSIYGNLGHLLLETVNDLGAESCFCSSQKRLEVVR
mmetsp:Transcript_13232/g.18954  ORF Transcript_13232/g.18954 Transcript_13232/m.18954 type:complete len:246 (-) Transcript_13232:531-1268(-)